MELTEVHEVGDLRAVAELFDTVWGGSPDGPPVPADLLCSLVHAGGAVTVARTSGGASDGVLLGAAVAVRAQPGTAYSLIAATRPGGSDQGLGYALKQRQRTWALAHDLHTLTWTFDPLVGRNARFNLTKLGAEATAYVKNFYGAMGDAINAGDESDRLVATWRLDSPRAVACADGHSGEVIEPDLAAVEVLALAPDGGPLLVGGGSTRWLRVPVDMVALRRADAVAGAAWRKAVRSTLEPALSDGWRATGVTRSSWYCLEQESEESP